MKKPFLTPPNVPEGLVCRTLTIPSSKEWLGIFNSALLEMTSIYNYEQVNLTDLTIDETIAIVEPILDAWFNTPDCGEGSGCLLPGLDTPPFRLGANGHFEMLNTTTGLWTAPTGEYEIPPVPPREESTAFDRRCAAAENAAYVLFLVYEAITDEIAMGGDTLQAAAAMVAALVTAVGGWIAAPVYAIIQLTIALFAGVVEILQVLGADVWTADFNDKLKCALLECSTDTGDIVTFDLDCIREQLTVEPDLLDPDWFYDLQLFAQVLFLLETITMDGLNAAGATTGVVVFDCDDCGDWCHEFDFTVSDQGWVTAPGYSSVYSASGWGRTTGGIVAIKKTFSSAKVTSFGVEWSQPLTGNYHRMFYKFDGNISAGGSTEVNVGSAVEWGIFGVTGLHTELQILFQNNTPNTSNPLNYFITRVVINGTGENPFGDDNCETE